MDGGMISFCKGVVDVVSEVDGVSLDFNRTKQAEDGKVHHVGGLRYPVQWNGFASIEKTIGHIFERKGVRKRFVA